MPHPARTRRRVTEILLVACGGCIGTAARFLLSAAFPLATQMQLIFGINLLGSLILGMLLESLDRSALTARLQRRLRLLLGTGILGGFTTYSALAADTAILLGAGDIVTAVLLSVGSVVLGVAAAAAGMRLTMWLTGTRRGTA